MSETPGRSEVAVMDQHIYDSILNEVARTAMANDDRTTLSALRGSSSDATLRILHLICQALRVLEVGEESDGLPRGTVRLEAALLMLGERP